MAKRRHGLPPGVPVPGWALQRGQHAYFAPAPAELGNLGGKARGGPGSNHLLEEPGQFSGIAQEPLEGARGGNELGLRAGYAPPLRYLGGAVQAEPKLHVIFWGSNFNESTGLSLRTQLLKFYNGLNGSAEQGILTQYFDPQARITPNVSDDYFIDTRVSAPSQVTEQSVEEEVNYAIGAASWSRSPEAQFELITAPGTTYNSSFAEGYCAFHNLDSHGDVYSFVPYAGDEPFREVSNCPWYGNGNAINATSVMASHEYAESATDPLWDSSPGWKSLEGNGRRDR
ncbi:MAG: hypothetical protein WB507_09175 [Solirubrobacterales bacterium]